VHEQARLIHSICKIRTCQGQVLECTRNAAVERRVIEEGTLRQGELWLGVDRCRSRLAVQHPSAFKNVFSILCLVEEEAMFVALNLHTEEEPDVTKILDCKFLAKQLDDVCQEITCRSGEQDVIDIDKQISCLTSVSEDEERCVGAGGDEANASEVATKTLKPRPGRLFKSIEGLDKTTDMVRVSLIDEACRLMAEHLFGKVAVQERILDVELMYRPRTRSCKMKDYPNCCRFDDRREGLVEVDARTLVEPTDHPSSLAALQGSVGVQFVLEDPLPCDDVCTSRPWHECPGAIGHEGIVLLLHRLPPCQIAERGTDRAWWRRQRRGGGEVGVLRVGEDDAVAASSHHGMPRRLGWPCTRRHGHCRRIRRRCCSA